MNFQLTHIDANGNKKTSTEKISLLAFTKHSAFAGISHANSPWVPFRLASQLFEFAPSFYNSSRFSILPELADDPTEIAYISNRIGRAFADYLSKKIYGARFTHSYECVMSQNGLPISGKRPDFYCDTLTKQFTVEAKGYSRQSISDNDMTKHKAQSKTGPLKVHFSVASISYNLYGKAKIKFYDPEGNDVTYNEEINNALRAWYYEKVLYFVKFIADSVSQSELSDYIAYNMRYPISPIRRILLHKAISERNWGDTEWLMDIKLGNAENEECYVDVDGIGLSLR